jgi:hypothetical protein
MKKKKLPEIIITGTPQELVEIEPLLVMAGYYKSDELWNNHSINQPLTCRAYCDNVKKRIEYHTHTCDVPEERQFKASEIHKILHYIETGEIKEYFQDTAYFKERQEWIKRAIGKIEESEVKCITGKTPFYFDRGTGELSTKKPIKYTPEPKTHTGQAGVVGNVRVKTNSQTITTEPLDKPIFVKMPQPSAEGKIKSYLRKMKLKKWKQVQKEFKQWADPKAKNCIGYYSPTSQLEILAFFKKQFIK